MFDEDKPRFVFALVEDAYLPEVLGYFSSEGAAERYWDEWLKDHPGAWGGNAHHVVEVVRLGPEYEGDA